MSFRINITHESLASIAGDIEPTTSIKQEKNTPYDKEYKTPVPPKEVSISSGFAMKDTYSTPGDRA